MHIFLLSIFVLCLLYMRFVSNSYSDIEQMFIMMIAVLTMSQMVVILDHKQEIEKLRIELQKLKVKMTFKDTKL